MVRVDHEGCGVFRPGIADGLEGLRQRSDFEVLSEVVGGDEGRNPDIHRTNPFKHSIIDQAAIYEIYILNIDPSNQG